MEDITDVDFARTKKNYKDFEIKKFREISSYYVQSDALLLAMYLRTLEICVLKYTN